MSQQTPTQRGVNQGEEQINLQNNIVDGLSKRPPFEYIATLDSSNLFLTQLNFGLYKEMLIINTL